MSIVIALDPNVLIAAAEGHRESVWALQELTEEYKEQVCICLDPWNKIFPEYWEHLALLNKNEVTSKFITEFFDRSKGKLQTIHDAKQAENNLGWFDKNNCGEPVEPELILTGCYAASGWVLITAGLHKSNSLGLRGTDQTDIREIVHNKFSSVQIWGVNEIRRKLAQVERARYPSTEDELQQFILNAEYEYMEFKQPNGNQVTLTTTIKHKALEAVCGMVNCDGGRVFVGVSDSRQIIGIEGPRMADGQPDNDLLSRNFSDMFSGFRPSVNQYVKPSIIPLSNGRRVVCLHVMRAGNGQRFAYRRNDSLPYIEFDRCGASTRETHQFL